MRHKSELEAEVPAEQFRDRKCTFLELFQVPGTPIFLKICRELGEHVGDTAGQLFSQGEAAGHFFKKRIAGRLEKVAGRPPAQIRGLFGLFNFFYIYPLTHTFGAHNFSREIFSSFFLNHFFPQIRALYAFSNAPRKLFSRKHSVSSTLNRFNFGFGASFLIFAT